MHHFYEQSLKSEISRLSEDKRQMQRSLHQWQTRFEKCMVAIRDLSCEGKSQQDQTKLSQAAVDATVRGTPISIFI